MDLLLSVFVLVVVHLGGGGSFSSHCGDTHWFGKSVSYVLSQGIRQNRRSTSKVIGRQSRIFAALVRPRKAGEMGNGGVKSRADTCIPVPFCWLRKQATTH